MIRLCVNIERSSCVGLTLQSQVIPISEAVKAQVFLKYIMSWMDRWRRGGWTDEEEHTHTRIRGKIKGTNYVHYGGTISVTLYTIRPSTLLLFDRLLCTLALWTIVWPTRGAQIFVHFIKSVIWIQTSKAREIIPVAGGSGGWSSKGERKAFHGALIYLFSDSIR